MTPTDQGQQAPTLLGWVGADLHNAIMNIPVIAAKTSACTTESQVIAYKIGHRDARHTAAELVVTSGLSGMLALLVQLNENIDRLGHGSYSLESREGFDAQLFMDQVRGFITKAQGGTQ